jgi:hypothetical protein
MQRVDAGALRGAKQSVGRNSVAYCAAAGPVWRNTLRYSALRNSVAHESDPDASACDNAHPSGWRAGARRRALGRGRMRCRATRLRSSAPFGAAPLASFPLHDVKQRSFFVPAARLRVRVCLALAPDPEPFVPTPTEGQAERREAHCLELVALVSARRHACEAWAVPRNRDAASRRSTVALSAQGPLPSPALPPAPVRRLHAAGRKRARPRPRASRIRGYEPRSTPLPAPR